MPWLERSGEQRVTDDRPRLPAQEQQNTDLQSPVIPEGAEPVQVSVLRLQCRQAWDAAAASQACHFHHDAHALPDFVGGFCQTLDNENAVPMEASLVGTASIVLAAQSAVQGRAPVAAPASQELSASPKHQGKSPRRAKSKDKDRLLASFIDSSITSLQPYVYILLVSD